MERMIKLALLFTAFVILMVLATGKAEAARTYKVVSAATGGMQGVLNVDIQTGGTSYSYPGGCPIGSICSMYIATPNVNELISTENTTFSTWTTTPPSGVRVSYGTSNGDRKAFAAILGIYTVYAYCENCQHYNQINFYVPNTTGTEPYGTFDPYVDLSYPSYGNDKIVGWWVKDTGGTEYYAGYNFVEDAVSPGVFAWQHYNVVTQTYTSSATCAATPSACPISTNGQSNYLIFYTTGGERLNYLGSGNSSTVEHFVVTTGDNPMPTVLLGGVGQVPNPNFQDRSWATAKAITGTGAEQFNVPIIPVSGYGIGFTAGVNACRVTNGRHLFTTPASTSPFNYYSSHVGAWYPSFNITLGAAN